MEIIMNEKGIETIINENNENNKNTQLTNNKENMEHIKRAKLVSYNFPEYIFSYLNKEERLRIRLVSKFFCFQAFSYLQKQILISDSKCNAVKIVMNDKKEFNINNKKKKINVLNNNKLNTPIAQYPTKYLINNLSNLNLLKISNIVIDKEAFNVLDTIISKNKIRKLEYKLNSFGIQEDIDLFVDKIFSKLSHTLTTLHMVGQLGNRDRMILNIEKNKKPILLDIEKLVLEILPINQIIFILSNLLNKKTVKTIEINSCPIDEELSLITNVLKEFTELENLSLCSNGFVSNLTKETLKIILNNIAKLKCLKLTGLWFNSYIGNDLFNSISNYSNIKTNLVKLDLSDSKCLFNNSFELNYQDNFCFLTNLENLKELVLVRCSLTDKHVKHLFNNISDSNSLEIIDLTINKISNNSIVYFYHNYEKFTKLVKINFSYCKNIDSIGFNIFLLGLLKDNAMFIKNNNGSNLNSNTGNNSLNFYLLKKLSLYNSNNTNFNSNSNNSTFICLKKAMFNNCAIKFKEISKNLIDYYFINQSNYIDFYLLLAELTDKILVDFMKKIVERNDKYSILFSKNKIINSRIKLRSNIYSLLSNNKTSVDLLMGIYKNNYLSIK